MSDPLQSSLRRLVVKACAGLAGTREADVPKRVGLVAKAKDRTESIVSGEIASWGSITKLLPRNYLDDDLLEATQIAMQDKRPLAYHDRVVWAFILGMHMRTEDLPTEFLHDYFDTLRGCRFDDAHFSQRYSEMLRFFDEDAYYRLNILVPLWGLDCEARRFSIGDCQIRKIDADEVAWMANRSLTIRFTVPLTFTHVLEFGFKARKALTEPGEVDWDAQSKATNGVFEVAARVNQEIVLLRCFTNQVPRAVTFGQIYVGWPSYFFQSGGSDELPWRNSVSSPAPALTYTQIRSFRRLRERFLSIAPKSRQSLDAAARRIALAEDAAYAGDQVVDFVTAMEGLLLRDTKVEAKYRFKERVAVLLGTGSKRLALARRAAELYDLRSDVVHGRVVPDQFGFGVVFLEGVPSAKKKPYGDVETAARDARQMAKDCLKKITLLDGEMPDWDKEILG